MNDDLYQINQFTSREVLESLDKNSNNAHRGIQELLYVSYNQSCTQEEYRDISRAQLEIIKDAAKQKHSDKRQKYPPQFYLTKSENDVTYEWEELSKTL